MTYIRSYNIKAKLFKWTVPISSNRRNQSRIRFKCYTALVPPNTSLSLI